MGFRVLRGHRQGRFQLLEIAASLEVRDDDLGVLVPRRAGDAVRHVHVALVAGRAPQAQVEPPVAEQQGGVRAERTRLADEGDVAGGELDLVERAHERAEEPEPGVHHPHAVRADDAHVGVARDRLDPLLEQLAVRAALREAGAHHHAGAAAAVVGGPHHVGRVLRRHHHEHEVGGGGKVLQGRDRLVSLHRLRPRAHRVHRPRESAVAHVAEDPPPYLVRVAGGADHRDRARTNERAQGVGIGCGVGIEARSEVGVGVGEERVVRHASDRGSAHACGGRDRRIVESPPDLVTFDGPNPSRSRKRPRMTPPVHGPTSHIYYSQRLRLHYVDWGNRGAPPLLLVHGGRDHCRSWDWVAEALRADYHVIAPDLRGHGDSQWIQGGAYMLADYVYDIAQLLHQTRLVPATVVSHSLGGAISLQYAGLYPANVVQLVAIEGMGPPPALRRKERLPGPERFVDWIDDIRRLSGRSPRRYASIEDAFRRMQEENPHLTPGQARHLTVHGVSQNEDGSYSWKFDNYGPASSRRTGCAPGTRWRPGKRIRCPTLLVRGTESWAADPTRGRTVGALRRRGRRQRRGGRALGAPRPARRVHPPRPGVPRLARISHRLSSRGRQDAAVTRRTDRKTLKGEPE